MYILIFALNFVMANKQPEYALQKKVCAWLELVHPTVLYESSLISQVKLTIPQQKRIKSVSKRGYFKPDIAILQKSGNGKYIGFHLELKADTPYLKDGVTLKKSEHLEDQYITIKDLMARGYRAGFFWDFDSIVREINDYIHNE